MKTHVDMQYRVRITTGLTMYRYDEVYYLKMVLALAQEAWSFQHAAYDSGLKWPEGHVRHSAVKAGFFGFWIREHSTKKEVWGIEILYGQSERSKPLNVEIRCSDQKSMESLVRYAQNHVTTDYMCTHFGWPKELAGSIRFEEIADC